MAEDGDKFISDRVSTSRKVFVSSYLRHYLPRSFVKALICLQVFALTTATLSHAGPRPAGLPDLSEQFLFGFEPTRTNFLMLFDSAYAVAKKAVTGKGKGVLEIEGRGNTAARKKYLELLKRNCPECKVSEIRESHGTISYRITYPDRTYIGSSLDAGALEWQTMPSTVSEITANRARNQLHMFELPREAGAWMLLDALGGHVTESGYDDPMFWLASLKLEAETPELSWGFFGKDGYNATPVKRWAPEQQARYRQVALEYDAQWKKFLRAVETEYAGGRAPSAETVMTLFESREIMDRKTLAGKMAEIYHNPKQESKFTGKRSKPKYVSHRPGIAGEETLLIENRSMRPQSSAKQLELLAAYRLRRAEYIKSMLDQGLDVDFFPGHFDGLSKNETAASAKAIIQELGLEWSDYADFGPVTNPVMAGKERKLADFFSKKEYGVAQREKIFSKVLDSFYLNPQWSDREWKFVLNLTAEHGSTVEKLENELKRLTVRLSEASIGSLSIQQLEVRLRGVAAIVGKFRAPSKRLYASVERALDPIFRRMWSEGVTAPLGDWIQYLSDDELQSWAHQAQRLLMSSPSAATFEIQGKIIQDLEFRKVDVTELVKGWYSALAKAPPASLSSIPESLLEMDRRLGQSHVSLRREAYATLIEAEVKWPKGAIREADGSALLLFAELFPEREEAVLQPYRVYLFSELQKRGFGLRDYYHSVVLSEKLVAATPLREKENTLRGLLKEVEAMHSIKNDPDSRSFIERIENELSGMKKQVCSTYLGSTTLQRLRRFLLGGDL